MTMNDIRLLDGQELAREPDRHDMIPKSKEY